MKTNNDTIPTGFILTDGQGGFMRRLKDKTVFKMPMTERLQQVHIAQEVLDYESAFQYVKTAAKEHELKLVLVHKERNTFPTIRKGMILLKRRTGLL